ncbi:MAG: ABC transporter substrate-binding protein [Oscillospiraceae bacterium]|nr:ABC transporter substrate-binding protein [Oscillospiraceae bacterium]
MKIIGKVNSFFSAICMILIDFINIIDLLGMIGLMGLIGLLGAMGAVGLSGCESTVVDPARVQELQGIQDVQGVQGVQGVQDVQDVQDRQGRQGNQDNQEGQDIHERIVVGFSQLGDESEWRTSSSNDIKRAAEQAGVQLMFDNAQQQQFNQIKAIRSFILKGVDVIAFCPIVEEGWDNILQEAKAAGIPVIVVDREIKTETDGLYSAFIGSDFNREGVKAGGWIASRFADAEGPVYMAEISGTINSSPAIGRYNGVREVLKNNPKFEIVISISGDFMRSKGKECMELILDEAPEIDVLFAHNDDMALGAVEILEERGIVPGKDIVIVSVDAQKSGIEALKLGKVNCLVECSPYVGDELMDLVFKITGGEFYPKYTYNEVKIYTDTDDFATLPERP